MLLAGVACAHAGGVGSHGSFYVGADHNYSIVDSALDSVRFTLTKTLQCDPQGHLVSISSFVDPEGQVMGWHDFGNLEGPGWAANAVGGAWEIYRLGGFLHKPEWQSNALAILADYQSSLRQKSAVFVRAGGIYGSINHDTYDPIENVACSVAFRILLLTSRVLGDETLTRFAFTNSLAALDQFKMCDDRNGVATRGLLFMEKSWDTAYLWENAEAALAYFEAALETKKAAPRKSREYELQGLVILRAIARHHYGPYGFLTEGVDWNNHVGQQHHIDHAKFGAIRYTEPFLNNQHIVEPTLFYLGHLARQKTKRNVTDWVDLEGYSLIRLAPPSQGG